MTERQQRFIDLLSQIFELDKSDLDFGIYRILNIRHDEITKYLTEQLPQKITTILQPFASADNSNIERQMRAIEQQLGGAEQIKLMSDTIPMVKEYNSLKQQLQQGADLSALENDVYGALYSFFSRYYDEGDFISKRRYKEGVYAIPYEGEEVKLYWANQDQYYIKTSENFKDYTFLAGDYTVNFHIVDATTEQNNNKEADDKKRQFMLFEEDAENYPDVKTFTVEGKTLTIRFRFDIPDDPKKKYAEQNLAAIKLWLANQPDSQLMQALLRDVSNNPRKPLTLLEKHLQGYVAKNTFDYFIHKDLGGFLRRELDFFIKNEIMHLDDIDTDNAERVETYLAKVRAVKQVGSEIIRFLAQIEDFQKRLWLKKKFVVETQWCMTLDKIDEQFYDEIRHNCAQVEEWKQMYAIDSLQPNLEHTEAFTEVPSVLFLKQNQNLVVDTRHFSDNFKQRLVESIDNLDEQTNGIMFNADNFQALGLMQEKYKEGISAIYIDPPYNTSASEIMYKNGYKKSSWSALLSDRVKYAYKILAEKGLTCVTIDDFQLHELYYILNDIFNVDNLRGTIAIKNNPSGRSTESGMSIAHEYGLFYAKNASSKIGRLERTQAQNERYGETDENGAFEWVNFRKHGGYKEDAPTMYFPIYITENSIRVPKMEWNAATSSYNILEEPTKDEHVLYPIDETGRLRRWKWGLDRTLASLSEMCVKNDRTGELGVYIKSRLNDEGILPLTIWDKSEYSSTSNGANLLKSIFGNSSNLFSYPKSIFAVIDSLKVLNADKTANVLDFFAGSGTTGHAVIELNRQDGGNRKYILVEMGTYFDTVTLPRIKKVVYAKDWKDGKPLQRTSGVSQIVKYMRLESYEDALSNIELKKQEGLQKIYGVDNYLTYMLDLESKDSLLNTDAFVSPFSYEMKITEKNESRQRAVDVVETFNYLIGLNVVSQSRVRTIGDYAFQQIEGHLRDGRRALVIWRTMSQDLIADNNALDEYFQKYRINPQDREFDVIYVNGDNNIENLRQDNEEWKVMRIEQVFNKKMFE